MSVAGVRLMLSTALTGLFLFGPAGLFGLVGSGCSGSGKLNVDGGVGGDGGVDIPADTAHSGTRLKLAWYDFADGQHTWADPADLLDAMLAVPCRPMRWDDGVTRCTPDLGTVAYSDASCAQPVLPAGVKFGIASSPGCNVLVPTGSILRGSGQTTQTTLYKRDEHGVCSSIGGQTVTVQSVSEALPSSTLVTMTIGYQGSGSLAIATLQGDDGLLVPLQPHDRVNGVSCDLTMLASATDAPCFVVEAPTSDVFEDANCAQPSVHVDPLCERPRVAAIATYGCPLYFEVGSAVATNPSYVATFGTCSVTTIDEPSYPLTNVVKSLWLERTSEPSAAREQLIYVGAGDTRVRDFGRLYDTQLGTECTMKLVADGETATCRPSGPADLQADLYSDAACTQPLPRMVGVESVDGCVLRDAPTVVDAGNVVYRIGPIHAGDVYTGPLCTKYPGVLHDLGDTIDAAQLPGAVKRRDP